MTVNSPKRHNNYIKVYIHNKKKPFKIKEAETDSAEKVNTQVYNHNWRCQHSLSNGEELSKNPKYRITDHHN